MGEQLDAQENLLWVPSPARASLKVKKKDWGVWSADTKYTVERASNCNISVIEPGTYE